MTDPLGQSQVIPYLIGLCEAGYSFSLLSCEKADRFQKNELLIRNLLAPHPIEWYPIPYTPSPPILAKYWDLYQLKKTAIQIYQERPYLMTHCRSYVPTDIGLQLKKKYQTKLFFDMRGFWVDERVDGGLWNLNNPIYKIAYWRYKQKEAQYLQQADMTISLTHAGIREMKTWESYREGQRIEMIQCSTDFDLFQLHTTAKKEAARQQLGLPKDSLVLAYLGNIGTWYMLDEMLQFFKQTKQTYPDARFLFLTHEKAETIYEKLEEYQLNSDDFVITFAPRQDVSKLMAAADIGLFFITPAFSKISSSPTKLGELLAMGMPVICNAGVGDVLDIVNETNSGVALEKFDETSFQKAINQIPDLLNKDGTAIREKAIENYSLQKAIGRYVELYNEVLN